MQARVGSDRHRQLRQWVADRLRTEILEGRRRPGDWLRQESVAREEGVSQTPVREALKQLVAEGLLEHVPVPRDPRRHALRRGRRGPLREPGRPRADGGAARRDGDHGGGAEGARLAPRADARVRDPGAPQGVSRPEPAVPRDDRLRFAPPVPDADAGQPLVRVPDDALEQRAEDRGRLRARARRARRGRARRDRRRARGARPGAGRRAP